MTKIISGHEKELFSKNSEKMYSEYKKYCIDINTLDHTPTPEEIEEAKQYNSRIWEELEG